MELLMITNVCRLLLYLEDMIYIDSFRIRSVVEITQEWFQVKEVSMERLNNFNIPAGVQNFIALIKSEEIFFRYQILRLLNVSS